MGVETFFVWGLGVPVSIIVWMGAIALAVTIIKDIFNY